MKRALATEEVILPTNLLDRSGETRQNNGTHKYLMQNKNCM